jgi:hypothetical protein
MLNPIQERALDMLSAGCSRIDVAEAVHVPLNVLRSWTRAPHFKQEIAQRTLDLRREAQQLFEKLAVQIAESGRLAAEYLRQHEQEMGKPAGRTRSRRAKTGQKRTLPDSGTSKLND